MPCAAVSSATARVKPMHARLRGVIGDVAHERLHRAGGAGHVDHPAVPGGTHRGTAARVTAKQVVRLRWMPSAHSSSGGLLQHRVDAVAAHRDHARVVDADVEAAVDAERLPTPRRRPRPVPSDRPPVHRPLRPGRAVRDPFVHSIGGGTEHHCCTLLAPGDGRSQSRCRSALPAPVTSATWPCSGAFMRAMLPQRRGTPPCAVPRRPVRGRRHQCHVVERREQDAPVDRPQVHERVELVVDRSGRLGAVARRRAEPVLGSARRAAARSTAGRESSMTACTPSVHAVASGIM